MKLLRKIDWSVLNTYIEQSLIVANKHPEYDIWILNYSPKAQSKKFWDEYTMSCRGMVIDANGSSFHEVQELPRTRPKGNRFDQTIRDL